MEHKLLSAKSTTRTPQGQENLIQSLKEKAWEEDQHQVHLLPLELAIATGSPGIANLVIYAFSLSAHWPSCPSVCNFFTSATNFFV